MESFPFNKGCEIVGAVKEGIQAAAQWQPQEAQTKTPPAITPGALA
jgi:hypothetical protein